MPDDQVYLKLEFSEFTGSVFRVVTRKVDAAFADHIAEILKCECCQNNWDDAEHHHNEHCYGSRE